MSENSKPLVIGPKYPTLGTIPLAAWKRARAFLVRVPKYIVSLPRDPGPVATTMNPLLLRYFWRARTSSPAAPMVRSRVKVVLGTGVGDVGGRRREGVILCPTPAQSLPVTVLKVLPGIQPESGVGMLVFSDTGLLLPPPPPLDLRGVSSSAVTVGL